MNIRKHWEESGELGGTNLYLVIFLLVVLISSATFFSFYNIAVKNDVKRIEANELNLVELQKETVHLDVDAIVSGLLLFADHTSAKISDSNPTALISLAEDYKDYSKRMKLYDQVRYMDSSGMEIVRVNFNEGSPSVVPKDKLQNNGLRYYFKDVFVLKREEVFVSPLDLNIEEGKIERPSNISAGDDIFNSVWRPEREGEYSKPMIRFGMPVFDKGGKKRGVILFNYLGNVLLNRFEKIGANSAGQTFLVNKDGYWLKGPSNEKEWGFMQEHAHAKDANISNEFPEAAKKVFAKDSGQFYDEKGLFSFNTIYPIKEGMKAATWSGKAFADSAKKMEAEGDIWKIVSYVSPEAFRGRSGTFFRRLFTVYFLFLVVLGIGLFYTYNANNKKE